MKKILIANRGEIALRIMRSIKEMGILTVAIYSDADRNALHTKYADQAVYIGPSPSNQSYLKGDSIIEAAKRLNVDAIHPGFGFLSENADFARKVANAGIIFIGPPPNAIEMMGSKLAAKEAAKKYGVPLVPGTENAIENENEAVQIAQQIGFPVLIKASAGGGGKGMRIVNNAQELPEQMQRAISEANASFGDGSVFIEKYVSNPRHIEIQVLADNFGNIVHLFERECSIQRRHQKVIEEAPSSIVTNKMREQMGNCAIEICKACNYAGAGTVEFIVDEQLNFYFLEMNTRLQVEHPVTEMITDIDIVKEQVKIAQNLPLSFTQNDLKINGHAIELRVYAEDPTNNFLPDIGTLTTYQTPKGNGIRVDDCFEQGMEIPIYYDPMIAKLVTHASTRTEAIEKMKRAIHEYRITGIETTLNFGKWVMNHPNFINGNFDTHFIQKHFVPELLQLQNPKQAQIAAWVAAKVFNSLSKNPEPNTTTNNQTINTKSNWQLKRTL